VKRSTQKQARLRFAAVSDGEVAFNAKRAKDAKCAKVS
jgi:hypothetical protein